MGDDDSLSIAYLILSAPSTTHLMILEYLLDCVVIRHWVAFFRAFAPELFFFADQNLLRRMSGSADVKFIFRFFQTSDSFFRCQIFKMSDFSDVRFSRCQMSRCHVFRCQDVMFSR